MISLLICAKMNFLMVKNGILYVDLKVSSYNKESYLEKLSMENLRSTKTTRKYIRKNLGIERNIPLYISSDILLIRIKVNDLEYYINYINCVFFSYVSSARQI